MLLDWILKKRHKVISASAIITRDVTKNYSKRNIKNEKIVLLKNKKMQYSQQLMVRRNGVVKSIHVFVIHRIKTHKDKKKELILKPYFIGDTIRL
jgi:hypothetical protein